MEEKKKGRVDMLLPRAMHRDRRKRGGMRGNEKRVSGVLVCVHSCTHTVRRGAVTAGDRNMDGDTRSAARSKSVCLCVEQEVVHGACILRVQTDRQADTHRDRETCRHRHSRGERKGGIDTRWAPLLTCIGLQQTVEGACHGVRCEEHTQEKWTQQQQEYHERDRERERERERDRDTHTQRERERHTHRERECVCVLCVLFAFSLWLCGGQYRWWHIPGITPPTGWEWTSLHA